MLNNAPCDFDQHVFKLSMSGVWVPYWDNECRLASTVTMGTPNGCLHCSRIDAEPTRRTKDQLPALQLAPRVNDGGH